MKKMKKIFALLIAMVMVMGLSTMAFAQDVGGTQTSGKGQIVISNASKGETYKVIKVFDASVTGTENGSVRYTGEIPTTLTSYFTADTAGNISATKAAFANVTYYTDATKTTESEAETDYWTGTDMSDGLKAALKVIADADTSDGTVSDGSTLNFNNLDYGYYIVSTSQGDGAVTVTTTNPVANVVDKNTTVPVKDPTKKVDETDEVVSIGDTITYTITFGTANYDGEDQIDKYVIEDTLPSFLTNVTVTSLKIIEVAAVEDDPATTDVNEAVAEQATTLNASQYQFADKKITITWAQSGSNLYKNGSTIELVYTAKVTSEIEAGNVETNENTVTIKAYSGESVTENGNGTATETIKTFAAALQKTDETGADLAGATFQVPGLTVTGSNGDYTVVSYVPESTTAGTTMSCDPTGFLVIRGLSNETSISITEVAAPAGYNKLTAPVELPVTQTSEKTTTTVSSESKTTFYDSEGNVVNEEVEGGSSVTVVEGEIATNEDLVAGAAQIQNQKGATLPSTGGMGTTIFYILGTILVIGAGIVLVTRRRMSVG